MNETKTNVISNSQSIKFVEEILELFDYKIILVINDDRVEIRTLYSNVGILFPYYILDQKLREKLQIVTVRIESDEVIDKDVRQLLKEIPPTDIEFVIPNKQDQEIFEILEELSVHRNVSISYNNRLDELQKYTDTISLYDNFCIRCLFKRFPEYKFDNRLLEILSKHRLLNVIISKSLFDDVYRLMCNIRKKIANQIDDNDSTGEELMNDNDLLEDNQIDEIRIDVGFEFNLADISHQLIQNSYDSIGFTIDSDFKWTENDPNVLNKFMAMVNSKKKVIILRSETNEFDTNKPNMVCEILSSVLEWTDLIVFESVKDLKILNLVIDMPFTKSIEVYPRSHKMIESILKRKDKLLFDFSIYEETRREIAPPWYEKISYISPYHNVYHFLMLILHSKLNEMLKIEYPELIYKILKYIN